jgi:hypothetical protein
MFIFIGEASAKYCCSSIELIEKVSMEDLQYIGLINDEKIKKSYIDKFKINLTSNKNIQVYISKKHGNGAGKYKINNVSVNGKKVVLSLNFTVGLFEAGSAVINQRILFFKVNPKCIIVDVVSTH